MRLVDQTFPECFARMEAEIFQKPWTAEDFQPAPGMATLSLWDGDFCAAYALMRVVVDEAELYRIAVLPQYRRRGLASRLMQALMARVFAMGAVDLYLEVSHKNHGAVAFYMDLGFRETGRRNHYYGPDDHALLMKLPLKREEK